MSHSLDLDVALITFDGWLLVYYTLVLGVIITNKGVFTPDASHRRRHFLFRFLA